MQNDHAPCVDNARAKLRRRQAERDEQDYLERHNPRRISLIEAALYLLTLVLFYDAIQSGFARPVSPPVSPVSLEIQAPSDDLGIEDFDIDIRH
ncbi:hypothetical protein [Bosea psychrotolerans]|uniref:Uncharacterized protein n=1 Tax=Bosea psychrotolerans TaxID=1871628 RepID=A0A2S4M150_9HYPH|nr:hypothetical protein [Bosea psychrotolerans]POR48355.1 hypothetical protein CYD53_115103 [Bosea psychrotolerans]